MITFDIKARYMSRWIFTISLLMGMVWGSAQKNINPDSLLKLMPTMVDTQKMLAYHDICRYYVGLDKTRSIEAAQAALNLAEQKKDDKWLARCLSVLIAALNIHGENKNVNVLAERALKHALASNHKPSIMKAYEALATTNGMNSVWDKAIQYSDLGLKVAEEIKDTIGILNAINMLALCNMELNQTDVAYQYHQRGIRLSQQIGRMYEFGRAYAGLAEINIKRGEWQEAINHANQAATAFEKINYPVGQAQSFVFGASALLQLGKWQECRTLCQKILHLSSSAGNDPVGGEANNILGYVEIEAGNYAMANSQFEKAEKEARKGNNYKLLKDIYRGMEILATIKKDFVGARAFHHKFQMVSDSFFSKQILSNVTNYRVKYETAEKERLLAEEQEIKSRWIFGSAALLSLVIAFFLFLRKQQQMDKKRVHLEAEKARLEAELEHAEADRLREVDKLKSTFFANISHEIRTPLSLIIGPLDQMIKGNFTGDQKKYFRIMHKNGKRLLELVNQLLLLSKLESGKMKLRGCTGNIHALIHAIAFSFESMADRKNLTIQVHSPASEGKCCYDRDAVEKILVNLISNAIKFSHEGGNILVYIYPISDGFLKFEIRDTGIGIAEDQMPTIFDRFSKSTQNEIQPGSGLGLALVKELCELHGGAVSVISKEGEGAVFTVLLNVARSFFNQHDFNDQPDPETIPAQVPLQDEEVTKNPSTSFHPLKKVILIAEDNADVRTYIKDQLGDQYQVLEANNGKQGIELATAHVPDIIITDIMMPELDGHGFCHLVKNDKLLSHIPVIMLTSKAEDEDKIRGLESGADDFLTKPFQAAELVLKIKNWITTRVRLQESYLGKINAFTPDPAAEESMDARFLTQVRDVIQHNLDDEGFSVVELSQKVGFSRSQLHRKLSALTGKGPNEIIRSMRLEHAKQLLSQKSGNVSEIAYRCGFNSPAYFIKCFKDQYGITPGEL